VVAVTFAPMDELRMRRVIVVDESAPLGRIIASRSTADARAAAGMPGAIDEDAPLDESLESVA
jgi:hypothetical protein